MSSSKKNDIFLRFTKTVFFKSTLQCDNYENIATNGKASADKFNLITKKIDHETNNCYS
jgi:hypothetical protein